MSKFESIGTIHYRVLGKQAYLFFVPDSNHFLKYSDKSYAVFVSVCLPVDKDGKLDKDGNREALAVPLRNNEDRGIFIEKSVPIKIQNGNDMSGVLLQAAEKGTIVTVRVKREPGCSVVQLVGITFPAR